MTFSIRISPDLQRNYRLPAIFEASGPTVGDCLENLAQRYPQTAELYQREDGLIQIVILLNHKTLLSPNALNLARILKPTDELSILSILAGG